MAITWHNVGAANVGNPTTSLMAGTDMITSGLDRLSGVAQDQQAKGVKRDRASLHASLLDSAINSGGDEKEFMKESLRLSKESGLTPEQGIQEVESVKGILNQMIAPTTEQQAELDASQQSIQNLQETGQNTLNAILTDFDLRYPQASRTKADIETFQAQGGLDTVWSGLSERFKEADDEYKTRKEINKLAKEGGYSDFAIARALEKSALKDESFGWWGSSRLNSKQFKDQLAGEQRKYEDALANTSKRLGIESSFMEGQSRALSQAQQNSENLRKQFMKQNLSVFSSN